MYQHWPFDHSCHVDDMTGPVKTGDDSDRCQSDSTHHRVDGCCADTQPGTVVVWHQQPSSEEWIENQTEMMNESVRSNNSKPSFFDPEYAGSQQQDPCSFMQTVPIQQSLLPVYICQKYSRLVDTATKHCDVHTSQRLSKPSHTTATDW